MTPLSEEDLLVALERAPSNIRFHHLQRLCEQYFGKPRQKGSHLVFKTPWPGDPRINLQRSGDKAKPYQVRQVIAALRKLREQN
jgi:predicted RNA binding protein YcfA (HicA-like mRNA interferase family)